jgi:hypothetical protein
MEHDQSITIEIPYWSALYNQLMYSFFCYADQRGLDLKIVQNKQVYLGLSILRYKGQRILLDYSDDRGHFNERFDCDRYFKRSLQKSDYLANVNPLNFQVNFAYKPFKILSKIDRKILFDNRSRGELIRAIDYFETLTEDSHFSKTLKRFENCKKMDRISGRVIFMTRLWDPDRHHDDAEKERREAQNQFRIEACRILSKECPGSIVGIYPDYYSKKRAPDLLVDASLASKKNYLKTTGSCCIGVADDGLRDTPGWKIGEYTMLGMAIISTPINVHIQDFTDGIHFLSTGSRSNYHVLPELVNRLQQGNRIEEMQAANRNWYLSYLEPNRYVENILSKLKV